ncbi:ABC transporter permease [Rhodothermaceae bacterium RA]|nr:ABC transporter permease [Rhodothermaceae bacterium RA]
MNKTWIVARSEYLRRVRSKGFILTTLLLPLAIVVFLVVIVLLAASAFEEDETRTIAVVDRTGVLEEALVAASDEALRFVPATESEAALREAVSAGTYDGYLVLPADVIEGDGQVVYYSAEGGGSIFENRLDRRIERVVEEERMRRRNIDPELIREVSSNVPLRMVKLTEQGEEAGSTGVFAALGFGMGFLIFMMMVIYGSVVMQGVIDEKSSRVVEVIVSSVRPFELMLGKVLGIGAMGLTQMVVWSALILAGSMASGAVVSLFLDPAQLNLPDSASTEEILQAANITIPTFPPELFLWFILYFLLGYLLYASLYAAVGSLVESQQDAQGFLLPLLLPIIVAMYTLVPQVESPNSTLSLVLSMIPLTSPISAVVRMAVTDVPWWQMLLSLAILAATFLGVVWLAGRVYRVGILMYGKKPSPRELLRWLRQA